MAELTPAQLDTVMSTHWVKTRKSDGTCRCRIVMRGYDQAIEDPDETYASTPSLLTLKTLLMLAGVLYVDDLMLFGQSRTWSLICRRNFSFA